MDKTWRDLGRGMVLSEVCIVECGRGEVCDLRIVLSRGGGDCGLGIVLSRGGEGED